MSSTPISEALLDLFAWNPPTLVPQQGNKSSTKTRDPLFFDKHFSDRLVLKLVKRLPSLVHDIARTVDNAIVAASDRGIQLPPPEGLTTAQSREDDVITLKMTMSDEKAVAQFYYSTTATFCRRVASTLALHPSHPRWRSLLVWTSSTAVTGYPIADGFLSLIDTKENASEHIMAQRAKILKDMDEETRQNYDAMKKHLLLDSLASWEMTSLSAGGPDVMSAILDLSTEASFRWMLCPDRRLCLSLPKHTKEIPKVSKAVIRVDAENTPWNINASETIPSTRLITEQPRTPIAGPSRIGSKSTGSMPPPPPTERTGEHTRFSEKLETTRAGKRKRDNSEVYIRRNPPRHASTSMRTTGSIPITRQPTGGLKSSAGQKGKGKIQKDDNNDPFSADNHELARSIVQQAWAQSVRIDGTIIVIHSGNHEFIGIRHRQSQTLYISDLIEPPTCSDPGYGKIHVGIYIAAIRDAMDRAKQLESHLNSPGNHSDDGQDSSKRRKTGKSENSNTGAGSRKNDTNAYRTATVKNTFKLANRRKVVLLYLQYDIYDSLIPSTFVRFTLIDSPKHSPSTCPNPLSQQAICYFQPEECLTIILTSEIGRGATGVVLRGTLQVEACEALDVAVKLAFTCEQRDALWNEYAIYCKLKAKSIRTGIITPLGFFEDSDGGTSALVMPYAGVPLDANPELVVPSSHRKAILTTLRAIHRAGILHGDLRMDNLLVNDSELTIVDFGHSRQSDDKDAMDREEIQLQRLLQRQKNHSKRVNESGRQGTH